MPGVPPRSDEVPADAQCILCNRPNTAEAKMVQCDGCSRWYHFSCAGVGDSIEAEDQSYQCALCRPRGSRAPSSVRSTPSTTASAREAKLQLEMQQLAEEKELQAKLMAERAKQDQEMQEKALQLEKDRRDKAMVELMNLEKEFLARKFKLLHAQLDEDARTSSRASVDSGDRSAKSVDKVRCWIDNHLVILSAKSGKVISTGLTSQAGGHVVQTEPIPVTNTTQSSSYVVPAGSSRVIAQPGVLSEPFDDVISPIVTVHQGGFTSVGNSALPLPPLLQSTPRTTAQPAVTWQTPINHPIPSEVNQRVPTVATSVGGSSMFPQIPAPMPYGGYDQMRDGRCPWIDPRVGQYNPYVVPTSTMVSTTNSEAYASRTVEPATQHFVQPSYTFPPTVEQLGHPQIPRYEPQVSSDSYFLSRNAGFSNPLASQNVPFAASQSVPMVSQTWGNPRPPPRPPVVSVSSYQTPIPAVPNPMLQYGGLQPSYGPNAQQLAARHVVPKDLPSFAGDPTEWPIFWSSYETSTQMCGYNDSENLMRLQRCLKGDARKSVCSFLLHPSNVPEIINTLRVLYGRPEAIINSLLAEVRATPTPRPEKLGTVISFGLAVRNFCAHLVSTGQQVHLANPILMEELVEKLPANIKLDWALHKQRVQNVDLRTFADYMNVIVTAASSVTPVTTIAEKPRYTR